MTTKTQKTDTFSDLHNAMIEAVDASTGIMLAKDKAQGVAETIYTIALRFIDKGGKLNIGQSPTGKKEYRCEAGGESGFLGACYPHEVWVKSDEAGKHKVDTIPACWSQVKSNIKKAAEKGLSLLDYKTEGELRKALSDMRKAETAGESGNDAPTVTHDHITEDNAPFVALLENLSKQFDKLDGDHQTELFNSVQGLFNKYKAIAEKLVPVKPVAPANTATML